MLNFHAFVQKHGQICATFGMASESHLLSTFHDLTTLLFACPLL